MSVDLSQFHQVFFEESFEGLDGMETALMALDPEQPDAETINTVFRAAHSIKGGSATFGFSAVADFTHVLETLLDEIRSSQRDMRQQDVDLFLQSVDCLREMLNALQADEEVDASQAEELRRLFESILATPRKGGKSPAAKKVAAKVPLVEPAGGWNILFRPHVDVLRTGNEPLRIFRELGELGEVVVTPLLDQIPAFSALNPEGCYLAWQLTLRTDASREKIEEAFEWVVDESDLLIEPLGSEDTQQTTAITAEDARVVAINKAAVFEDDEQAAGEQELKPSMPKAPKPKKQSSADTASIRVGIDKVDALINMVGELVITQSMLGQLGSEFEMENLPGLLKGLSQLEQNTRELQESVMRIRMMPISFAFSRFPRMVRDLSRRLAKQIDLRLLGEQTELDKTVMEKIGDPLVHLVRNALDHGIETPDERVAAGKPATGRVTLHAYHQGGNVVIEISDDGKGLNREKLLAKAVDNGLVKPADAGSMTDEQVCDLIFQPGFSTAKEVSDVSGRGVGMDVVRRNIQELNGSVEINSQEGQGSRIIIRLPLTLAILDGQLVHVGDQTYVFPLVAIVESLAASEKMVRKVAGGCDVFKLRDEYVPIIRLAEIFHIPGARRKLDDSLLVVVEYEGEKVGIVVDDLHAQQQVVIKSLEQNYQPVEGVSGATILGDGTVALILDIPGLVKLAGIAHQLQSRLMNLADTRPASRLAAQR